VGDGAGDGESVSLLVVFWGVCGHQSEAGE
jgi:hypothetical protein